MHFAYNIKSRDIIIAKPNYQSERDNKTRPLLVISKQILTKSGAWFICVGISSTEESSPFLIPIDPVTDIEDVRLDRPSQVMCHMMSTIPESVIQSKACTVTPDFYKLVISKIQANVLDF
ncbi:MAG: type II toxin-antitoxin system PemK/MazF family toxin [Nitrosotalea sp.]